MAANRIRKYLASTWANTPGSATPPGFVMLPASLLGNANQSVQTESLHEKALRAAIAESEARFHKIMDSLRN